MPWHIGKSKSCPASKPHAVIKDSDGKVAGCHETEAKATKQMGALYASEERSMSRLERLRARINKWFDSEIEQEEQTRSVVEVKRQEDGRYRWFSVSATSAINRVSEIDSRELFDTMIGIAQMTGKYPERDFMHLGDHGELFRVGQTDFMARDGNVLITSGLYYENNELAEMEIQARKRNPDFWGDSIHYIPLERPEVEKIGDSVIPVWRTGKIKFVSTVPRSIAASQFVTGEVYQEGKRMLNDMEFGAFVSLMGDEDAAKAWLKRNADGINQLIDDEEIVTRAVDEGEVESEPEVQVKQEEVVEEVERVENQPEPETEVEVVEIGEEVVEAVVQRVVDSEAINALFHRLEERLEAVDHAIANLGVLAEKERSKLAVRLETLERDDDDKFVEMLDDMPRKQRVTVGYRPSKNANDDVPQSMEHQAESAMSALGDDALYPK